MIKFKRIRFKNILSFGNTWSEILLDEHHTNIIRGLNGSGKSSIGDIICFAVTGKALRKINKPKLVNFKNKKDLLVEIWFSKDDEEWFIRRGINPAIFEIYKNNVLVPQDAARDYQKYLDSQVLQFDYQIFTQISLISKAVYSSFIKFTTDGRRKFIENILGLNVFSAMMDIHYKTSLQLNKDLRQAKTDRTILVEKIRLQEEYIKRARSVSVDHLRRKQDTIRDEIAEKEDIISDLREKIIDVTPIKEQANTLESKMSEVKNLLIKAGYKIDHVQAEITFFEDHDTCPTCSQVINKGLRLAMTEANRDKMNKFGQAKNGLLQKVCDLQKQIDVEDKKLSEQAELMNSVRELTSEINRLHVDIGYLEKEIQEFESSDSLDNEIKTLEAARQDFADIDSKIKNMLLSIEHHEAITVMLKDTGIKQLFIRRYIPIINRLVNHYLTRLDFFVRFQLDDEFNENIYSGGMTPLSYFNFSEGEKLRIDLALALTWREIVRIRGNVTTNLLLLDELPFDGSIDEVGMEYCLDLLKSLPDTNLIIITHAVSKWDEDFDAKIQVTRKPTGFSACNLVRLK